MARPPRPRLAPLRLSRFLFVFPPAPGPLGPAAAVARELTSRGHEIAWVGLLGAGEERIGGILPRDATILAPEAGAEVVRRSRALRGESSSLAQKWRLLWEEFLVPFARATLPHVEDAIDAFRPEMARRVVDSGAGLRLRINRVDPPTLRGAADRVEELVSTSRPERARPGSRSPQNKPS